MKMEVSRSNKVLRFELHDLGWMCVQLCSGVAKSRPCFSRRNIKTLKSLCPCIFYFLKCTSLKLINLPSLSLSSDVQITWVGSDLRITSFLYQNLVPLFNQIRQMRCMDVISMFNSKRIVFYTLVNMFFTAGNKFDH